MGYVPKLSILHVPLLPPPLAFFSSISARGGPPFPAGYFLLHFGRWPRVFEVRIDGSPSRLAPYRNQTHTHPPIGPPGPAPPQWRRHPHPTHTRTHIHTHPKRVRAPPRPVFSGPPRLWRRWAGPCWLTGVRCERVFREALAGGGGVSYLVNTVILGS